MKKLGFLFVLSLLFSCTKSLKEIRHCNDYKSFIKINWVQQSNGIFKFKDNPKYWHNEIYSHYIKNECLIGRSKKDIKSIFGTPSKMYANNVQDLIIYNMDELSMKMPIYGGSALFFEFKNGKVIDVFTNPGQTDLPD